MDLLTKAELKLGKFAIPGIIRIVAGFQLLVFVLLMVKPGLYELLILSPARVFEGEVWRLFTFVFIPRTLSPIWILIHVMFLFFINDGLEEAWGSFKLNVYFLSSMFCLIVGSFALWKFLHVQNAGAGALLYYSLFFAFAVLHPDRIINFMLILPVKIKYLAYLLAGYLVLGTLQEPVYGALIAVTLFPFAVFALPPAIDSLRHRLQVAERRQEYRQHSLPLDEAFHRCTSCGKTEHDDPHLEFRVASDDKEYCVPCIEARKATSL
jgi:hypothetical protein